MHHYLCYQHQGGLIALVTKTGGKEEREQGNSSINSRVSRDKRPCNSSVVCGSPEI